MTVFKKHSIKSCSACVCVCACFLLHKSTAASCSSCGQSHRPDCSDAVLKVGGGRGAGLDSATADRQTVRVSGGLIPSGAAGNQSRTGDSGERDLRPPPGGSAAASVEGSRIAALSAPRQQRVLIHHTGSPSWSVGTTPLIYILIYLSLPTSMSTDLNLWRSESSRAPATLPNDHWCPLVADLTQSYVTTAANVAVAAALSGG